MWVNRRLWMVALFAVVGLAQVSPTNAVELQFAGRKWLVKEAAEPVGPGPNRFSADPSDVWVDEQGLHLTIHKRGDHWYSTEVILDENLGYGTYLFRTTSRQDLLDDDAVFGAFTWDNFGDDPRIPDYPNREIDFEDSRWGEAGGPNSQIVVQPGRIPGNHFQFNLPDLAEEPTLTRYFTWLPGKIEFVSLHGEHQAFGPGVERAFHRHTYVENVEQKNVAPQPGRENFRFNLWLYQASEPKSGQPVEVVIRDFEFIPADAAR